MKRTAFAAVLLAPLPVLAQPPTRLFSSSADVQELIAKARAEHKSDADVTIEHIATLPGYPVQLEYRTGVTAPTIHPTHAELIEVIGGSCTLMTGGTLTGVTPGEPGAETLVGTAIEGGSPRRIAKGDYVLISANTPHQYRDVRGLSP